MHQHSIAAKALFLAISTTLISSPAFADFNWDSKRNRNNDPAAQGTYTEIANTGDRNVGLSNGGYNTNQVDGVPVRRFADYFYVGDSAYWSNINIPALNAGQFLSIESRAGGYQSQEFKLELFPAGANGSGSPVYTAYTKRMRWNTAENGSNGGWQGAAWNYQPYVNLGNVPTGNYDIRITATANEGGHFAGLGVWVPQYTGPAGGHTLRIEAEKFSWSNGEKYQSTDGSTTYSGEGYLNQPMNADGGTGYTRDWIDYEIYNPRPGRKYTMTMATRSGNANPAEYELQSLYYWGDIVNFGTPLVHMSVAPSGGWEGTPFVRTTSSEFELPSGENVMPLIRLSRVGGDGQHIDYLDITATPTVWKAAGTSGTWGDNANWTNLYADNGDTATFNSTAEAHSVTLNSNRTVSALTLDSASTYNFSGPGKITLKGDSSGPAQLTVVSGSHTINTGVVLASNTTVTIPAGATLSAQSLSATSPANTLALSGGGTLALTGTSGNGAVSTSGPLTVATDGSLLDLKQGAIVFSGMTEADVRGLIKRFLAGNGGLGSSSVVAGTTTLGLFVNDEGLADTGTANGVPYFTSFGGVSSLSATDILVRYTYAGDTNLDGVVDGRDFKTTMESAIFGRTGWSNGDFNYDGVVDGSDLALVAANLNSPAIGLPAGDSAAATSSIPEPSALALIPGVALLASRRRR